METTADLDQNKQPECLHHKIVHINPSGPVGARGILRLGDEILEVNGRVLRGLQPAEAVAIVRDTPTVVRLVVCRPMTACASTMSGLGGSAEEGAVLGGSDEASAVGNSLEVADRYPDFTLTLSNDSDDDHTPQDDNLAPYQGDVHPLPAIDYLVGDFTRRFERQSWRERHEEERRRLKQKFEVRYQETTYLP